MAQPYDFSIGQGIQRASFQDFSMGVQGVQAAQSNALDIQAKRDAVVQQQIASAQQQQAFVAAQQQAQLKAEEAAALKAELLAESQQPGGPTALGLQRIVTRNPQLADSMKDNIASRSKAEQEQLKGQATSTFVRAMNGDVEGAAVELEDAAKAYENSPGREQDAEPFRKFAKLLRDNPAAAKTAMGVKLAVMLGPDYDKTVVAGINTGSSVAKAGAEAVKADAEAKIKNTEAKYADKKALADIGYTNTQAQRLRDMTRIEGRKLALDEKQFDAQVLKESALAKGLGGLSEGAQKIVADASVAAAAATQEAELVGKMAQDFNGGGIVSQTPLINGVNARLTGFISDVAGVPTDETKLRKSYKAYVERIVGEQLKGMGSATESERDSIRSGMPDPNGDYGSIREFLIRQQDTVLQRRDNRRAEIEYVSQNGSLLPASRPLVVRGVQVAPGQTLDDALTAARGAAAASAESNVMAKYQ